MTASYLVLGGSLCFYTGITLILLTSPPDGSLGSCILNLYTLSSGGIPLILVRAVYDNQMELQTLVAAFSFSNGSLL